MATPKSKLDMDNFCLASKRHDLDLEAIIRYTLRDAQLSRKDAM